MEDRFDRAFDILAVHEGGYVNHPKDPGGATNKGVTQRTYNSFRARQGQGPRDVRDITDLEVEAIYRSQYWATVKADQLPPGLAYCVFDASVNSGPAQAAKWLQEIIGARIDGVVGNETLSKIAGRDVLEIITRYCQMRLAFMRRLKHWPTFKRGWSRRVEEVKKQSLVWATQVTPARSVEPQPAKAQGPARKTEVAKDMLKDGPSWGAITGLLGSVTTLMTGNGPVQYAFAFVLVLLALAAIWWLVRGRSA